MKTKEQEDKEVREMLATGNARALAIREINRATPLWKQVNLLVRRIELLEKGQLTPEEDTELLEVKEAFDNINRIRKESNK